MQKFGDFRIDPQNECLWHGEEMLSLTPRPFAVLRYLVENPQRLITHDELLEALWPEAYVQPQVLQCTYILELRKLLGDDPACPRYIQTIPKRGYRFLFAVSDVSPNGHHSAGGLVGRQSEQDFLFTHLQRVKKAERATIFITGEPGIGKTSLLDAFCAANCREDGVRVARGQSIEGFGGKESFYPVREALNDLCSADDGKARSLLASAAPSWSGRNGASSLGELCEAFESIAAQHPLVLIFEDIHWADSSTLDLISALARRRSRAKLMLLASYRPSDIDTEHPLRNTLEQDLLTNSRSEELRLGPLNKQAVSEYLRRELRSEKLPSGLSSLVHQHSAGNPLFMTAVLEHLRTQNLFRMDDGQLNLSQPLSEIELGVPDGLAGIIEFQLEKLNDEDRRLLEAGSIGGSIFPAWAAAAALNYTIDEVEEAYAALVRRVRILAIAGQDELPDGTLSAFYVFSHALYREVLYNRMPAARRAQWHRRVADRLRDMFAGHESSVAYEIAAHAEAGGVPTR